MRADLAAALTLLTRLPGVWLAGSRPAPPGRAVWAYPVVGALVGGCGWAVVWLAASVSLSQRVGVGLALVAMTLVTGGLHEDGLADMADGFGGGYDRDSKLAIMRDSRVGSYGVLALVLTLGLRWSALAGMARAGASLMAACALSRAAMVGPILLLPPARTGGMGASLGRVPMASALGCAALAIAAACILVSFWMAVSAAILASLVAVGVAWLARRQIGGFTGDVAGACAVLAETAVLVGLAGAG